jgi:ParB/RepB/Spo0J family partition protein
MTDTNSEHGTQNAEPAAADDWVEFAALDVHSQNRVRAEVEKEIDQADEQSLLPRAEQVALVLAEYLFHPLAGGRVWRKMKEAIVQQTLKSDHPAKPAREKKVRAAKATELPGQVRSKGVTGNAGGAMDSILTVPRERIVPSPLNPRKLFDAEYLAELAQSLKENGIINPLIVRPKGDLLELVAGECRWRASEKAGLMSLPVIVRALPDHVVLEQMMAENMKRKDLTVLEEAAGFARMLAQAEDGKPRYTIATLADKIGSGRSYIEDRLRLEKLSKHGRKALESGRISFNVAREICKVPRAILEKVEDEVLNPDKYDHFWDADETLTAEQTAELIREHYVRSLQNPPFELSKPDLVPVHTDAGGERTEGGPCTDCPWNTANQTDGESRGRAGRGRAQGETKSCLNPACFAKKVEVNIAAQMVKASADGCKILTPEESKRVVVNGVLQHNSAYVMLDKKPDVDDLAHRTKAESAPTWQQMVGDEVKPVVAVDGRGHVFRLVEKKQAIAAAQKNGHEKLLSLSGGRARSTHEDAFAAQQRKDREKGKEKTEVVRRLAGAIVAKIESNGLPEDIMQLLIPIAAAHAKNAGANFVCNRRGIEKKPDVYEAMKKACKKTTGDVLAAFIVEMLIAEALAWSCSPHSSGLVPEVAKGLVASLKIDVKAIEADVKRDIAEKKKPKKKDEGGGMKDEVKQPAMTPEERRREEIKTESKKAAKKAKSVLTPAERAKLAAAMKARWAALKRG